MRAAAQRMLHVPWAAPVSQALAPAKGDSPVARCPHAPLLFAHPAPAPGCAGKRAFYARPPYLNKDLGAGGHVTRFIALAEVRASRRPAASHAAGALWTQRRRSACGATPAGPTAVFLRSPFPPRPAAPRPT